MPTRSHKPSQEKIGSYYLDQSAPRLSCVWAWRVAKFRLAKEIFNA